MNVVEGERRFAAPPERVFELLTSPDVIASAIPAVCGHRVLDADHWEAKVKAPLPLAPAVKIRFDNAQEILKPGMTIEVQLPKQVGG